MSDEFSVDQQMTDNQQDALVSDQQSEDEFLRVTAAHQTLIEGNISIPHHHYRRSGFFSSSTNL